MFEMQVFLCPHQNLVATFHSQWKSFPRFRCVRRPSTSFIPILSRSTCVVLPFNLISCLQMCGKNPKQFVLLFRTPFRIGRRHLPCLAGGPSFLTISCLTSVNCVRREVFASYQNFDSSFVNFSSYYDDFCLEFYFDFVSILEFLSKQSCTQCFGALISFNIC